MPGLETARLSKHVIIDESIAHHTAQRESCLRATREIQLLQAERDELISEVNALRASYLPGQVNLRQARPVDVELLQALDIPPGRPVDTLAHGLHDGDLPQGQSQSQDSKGHPVPCRSTSMEPPLPVSAETETFSIPTAPIPAGLQPDAFSIPSSASAVPPPFFIDASFDTLTAPPSHETASANPPHLNDLLDETNDSSRFPQPTLNQGSTSLEPPSAGVSALSVGRPMADAVHPLPTSSDIDFSWQPDPYDLYDIQPEHFMPSSFSDDSHEARPLPRSASPPHNLLMIPEAQQAWCT